MNLTELKQKTAQQLVDIAEELNIQGLMRAKKHELIFAILQEQSENKLLTIDSPFLFLQVVTTSYPSLIPFIISKIISKFTINY